MLRTPLTALSLVALTFGSAAFGQTPLEQAHYIKTPTFPRPSDQYAKAIAIDGDTLVVGVPYEDNVGVGIDDFVFGTLDDWGNDRSGAVFIYRRENSTWRPEAYLKASNPGEENCFGWSVAIEGDLVVVGAPEEDTNGTGIDPAPNDNIFGSGAVYVFRRTGTTWEQEALIKSSNCQPGDRFGEAVSVSGGSIAVGAPGEDAAGSGLSGNPGTNYRPQSGAAFVFDHDGSAWSEAEYFKAHSSEAGDGFGKSIALAGDLLLVGAPDDDGGTATLGDNSAPDAGAAYTFYRSGSSWSVGALVKASNPAAGNRFGAAVDASAALLVVGAPFEGSPSNGVNGPQTQGAAPGAGAAYLYTVQPGGGAQQVAYLKASNSDGGDAFGTSVGLDGTDVYVGAPGEASLHGIQDLFAPDNSGANVGAAYRYSELDGVWSWTQYIKASNPFDEAAFGEALAASGGRLLVGSPHENGTSTGVNGLQYTQTQHFAGAAYGFELPPAACGSTNYGVGVNGSATLDATVLAVSSQTFTLSLGGFANDGPAVVALSLAQGSQPFLGGSLLLDPNLLIPGPGSFFPAVVSGGRGEVLFQVPAGLVGAQVFAQAGSLLTGELTNGVAVTVCP